MPSLKALNQIMTLAASVGAVLCTSPARSETDSVEAAWQALAVADVEAMHQTIIAVHPLMVDPETPDFVGRVAAAYEMAMNRALKAKDFADWRMATQGFIQSFRDGHVIFRLEAAPTRVRWPGFLLEGRAGGYFVQLPEGLEGVSHDVAAGDRLVACDGIPIEIDLIRKLDGIEADMSKQPERLRHAFRYFIDYRMEGPGPVASCKFDASGSIRDITVRWQTIAWAQLAPQLEAVNREVARPIGSRRLSNGALWLELGSFGAGSQLEALAKTLESDLEGLRSAPAIIVDLRGNRGGSSQWGYRLAAAIWGKQALDKRLAAATAAAKRPGLGKFWRATSEAAELVRASAARFRASGESDAAAYFDGVADQIDVANEAGQVLADDTCCRNWRVADASPSPDTPAPAYHGPVVLLTDAGCFSSCIAAILPFDLMGAYRAGETTGQNGEGGEVVGPLLTPSGLARYFVPASIIRSGDAARAVYPAQYVWDGSMNDDAAMEAWVASLAQSMRAEMSLETP